MSILSMETGESSNNALIIEMKRTAINSSGRLGSLYDGCRDRLVGQLNVDNQEKLYHSVNTVQCEIKYGDDKQPQNLLRRLPINEQLRLSILLNLAPNESVASIINYSHPTNEYTRLFCYSYVNRVQRLPDNTEDAKQFISSSMSSTVATHIITGIEWGIDLIVILQLPSDANTVKEIDHVLDKLLQFLLHDDTAYPFTSDDESLLERIVHTKVYANIPDLNNLTTVRDVCRYIKENINNIINYPISYTLQPIQWLNPKYEKEGATFIPLTLELNEKIEDYVLQLTADIKKLEVFLTENMSKSIDGHLKQQLPDVQKQWLYVKDNFNKEIERLSNIVIELRSGRNENLVTEQIFSNNEQATMRNSINDFTQNLKYLEEKERVVDCTDIEITIEDQSVQDDQRDQILCSSNYLKQNNSVSSSVDVDSSGALSPLLYVSTDETINILLLGETGVGKSTFINAFANYLTFDTLQEAQIGHPVVLIPVSFLITVGDNFEEHIVKLGDIDGLKNENFDCPGQSVTQRCKSYIFNLNSTYGKKLCIIDTPGFGDTRGVDQDDRNMEHILDYIKNLSHLNAVCFLLKPNESRLNIFYRSCFIQLSLFLRSTSCGKIIFCFTNARSTFYTPGDTAPLLKKMIASISMHTVPFIKENTFCFDNESFRYLVGLRNGISFNELEKEEYEMSWTKSVTAANRLIHYICKILNAHHMQTE